MYFYYSGDVLFLGNVTKGTIYSKWFDARPSGKEKCISILTYQFNLTSSLKFKVEKEKGNRIIGTSNASDTNR